MTPSHIEHIGIAVKNLNSAINFYERIFGLKCYKIEEIADQKVRTAFFMVGPTKIELLESTDPEGPIARFIEKRGEGIHHLAFAYKKIEDQLKHAEDNGVTLIDTVPRKGAEGLDIAFLHPKSSGGVLIEICEDKKHEIVSMEKYKCQICGYIYDSEEGEPHAGIKPGTLFSDLPEDYLCPVCAAGKDDFFSLD